jgi:hypothetical protein
MCVGKNCSAPSKLHTESSYRDRVTQIRCGKLKKLSADGNAEADGLKEPVLSKRNLYSFDYR